MKATDIEPPNGVNGSHGPARASANGPARRVRRVWLVDDNTELRETFARLLAKQPGIHCTRQFPSAEAVLGALAEERPPDVILLDVHLGGQSGMSAIRPIKQLAPTVKVLMLTMFTNSQYEVEACEAGASGFLLKSYEVAEIANLIHEVYRDASHPDLFPNMALLKEAGLLQRKAGTVRSGGSFTLAGALRRLCGASRRQTAV